MNLKVISLVGMICIALTACGDLESKAPTSTETGAVDHSVVVVGENQESEIITSASSLAFSDDYFETNKWYYYNSNFLVSDHVTYPYLDVLAIRTRGVYYKMQIFDYYKVVDGEMQSGFYKIRLQRDYEPIQEIEADGYECGVPVGSITLFCDVKGIYTLLNLETLETIQMSEEEAYKTQGWDIGFRRSQVIINNASKGNGDVQAALIYREKNFFDDKGNVVTKNITEALKAGGQLEAFESVGRLTAD